MERNGSPTLETSRACEGPHPECEGPKVPTKARTLLIQLGVVGAREHYFLGGALERWNGQDSGEVRRSGPWGGEAFRTVER